MSPSNRTVTHHAIVNVKDAAGTHRIGGYQPGGATTVYPRGIVRMIPKGASLALNMHYNPKGEAATDQTKIALVFARGPIDKVAITAMSGTRDLDIPPGASNYEAKGSAFVFAEDSHKDAIAAPKGSRLETFAHYDNSAANKSNPDPTQRVVYGPEIMNGYFDYTLDNQRYRSDTSGQ